MYTFISVYLSVNVHNNYTIQGGNRVRWVNHKKNVLVQIDVIYMQYVDRAQYFNADVTKA